MRLRQITNVDIISNRGAIWRGKVRSQNGKWLIGSTNGFDQQRNGVCFGLMTLPYLPLRITAGSIKVTQRNGSHAVSSAIVLQHALNDHLGPTIGVDRR